MTPSPPLPIEIVDKIIKYFCEDANYTPNDGVNSASKPFLNHTSVVDLLRLRLVGHSWSNSVSRTVNDSLHLEQPWVHKYIVTMWSTCLIKSDFFCLTRLSLNNVMFQPKSTYGPFYESIRDPKLRILELEHQHYSSKSIFMQDAADIIRLCGRKLIELSITFTDAVGFSDKLISAIDQIESLKSLFIQGNANHNLTNDSKSLANVLNGTYELESLLLKFSTLESLDVGTIAMPKLMHLSVRCDAMNNAAINKFCQAEGRRIKFLEFIPDIFCDDSQTMILGLQDHLEALFIDVLPNFIPLDLCMTRFPKLKILRTTCINSRRTTPDWAEWSFFDSVEIMITPHVATSDYRRRELEKAALLPLPPTLKHLVFTFEGAMVVRDEVLVRLFGAHGVKCHFMPRLSYSEVLVGLLVMIVAQHLSQHKSSEAHHIQQSSESEDERVDHIQHRQENNIDDSGFMITDSVNYLGAEKFQLVYDSGATKSTINNLDLLIDPKPISKSMNTYGGSVAISHVGKLNFGGTIIYPVYYSENGPRNLISTTQLEDHGMNIIHSHRKVQVRLGDKTIFRFFRDGDL
ncbi:uncharacterized protein MELLADRAFT_107392 [Melampsora larici-populina 98AG31]|uniref:Uncharacterized protein n=1 Tax=Melampsora larici-populina (strain 98AG31 / pathotype 3-4-7) TaxID=747676 RepID=F4RPN1_MELLP|nr:uncharacterized protein MELLADRAFT_107392 [Melampsora larici-populina 98AG31]EGG05567.1 hypothetical protein MELLADRAFT_107392 [Melampsora larici-populina 98AG31]